MWRLVRLERQRLGTVRIAPSVLATVASLTAQEVRGVARMGAVARRTLGGGAATAGRWTNRPRQQGTSEGVRLQVREGQVYLDVSVIAASGSNLNALGK